MSNPSEKIGDKASETTTAINSLVGFRRSEAVKSLGSLVGHALRQPKPFAKHLGNYAKELIDIASNSSEVTPHPKDRRFQDQTWQNNAIYRKGLQKLVGHAPRIGRLD